MKLDPEFWNSRYEYDDIPWDIGHVSPPLARVIDGLADKATKVLIPGAGSAYEAIYLHRKGFHEVYVCDWAADSFKLLRRECPDFPEAHLLVKDFFELEGPYNLILEQTFYCAILPSQRTDYARKSASLLNKGGVLTGVLFAAEFNKKGPPFGGTKSEYVDCFSPFFTIEVLEPCLDSILPRLGNELFIRLVVK